CRPLPGPSPTATAGAVGAAAAVPAAPLLAASRLAAAPAVEEGPAQGEQRRTAPAPEEVRARREKGGPQEPKGYIYPPLRPRPSRPENKPDDAATAERLRRFLNDPALHEDSQLLLPQRVSHYYGAIRASRSCLGCHRQVDNPDLEEGDLLAVIKVEVPT